MAFPIILLRLVWRSRNHCVDKSRWLERFGYGIKLAPPPNGILLHAVSVGEAMAAMPLIQTLLKTYPHLALTVTSTTVTGSERVQALLGDRVHHWYLPYDFPGAIKRFLKVVKPQLIILMETELWPNLIHYSRNIPLILANARLSASSARAYGYVYPLTQWMLTHFTYIMAQSIADKERFIQLGAETERVIVAGNLKYDLKISATVLKQAQALREALGVKRPIWIAASTHEGEEALILQAFTQVKQICKTALLILVPRHPQRFDKVAKLCTQQGFKVARRSKQGIKKEELDIYLGDTMGELLVMYGAADIAFVGGSLVPIGGHNVLEPAVLGKPILSGPYMYHFDEISTVLQNVGALQQVSTVTALVKVLVAWLTQPELAKQIGQQGRESVAENRGKVAQYTQLIAKLL